MDAFSYLSVLISIILGLAVTQALQGFRGLMLARSRVRASWTCATITTHTIAGFSHCWCCLS